MRFTVSTFCLLVFIHSIPFAQKQIKVDFGTVVDTVRNVQAVNKGPENLGAAYQDMGITHIRTHDYHTSCDYDQFSTFWDYHASGDTFSLNPDFDPASPVSYDWTATDSQIKEITDLGIEVFYRLGTSYPNESKPTHPYAPPLDSNGLTFSDFASLCTYTVRHFNEGWDNGYRYGIDYWEVWNEPGGEFWKGDSLQFYHMYRIVYDSLKAYDDGLKVGALSAVPVVAYGVKTAYRESFIQWLGDNGVGLDFYSWHAYSTMNPYGLMEYADEIESLLDENGFTDAENIIAETNYSLGEEMDEVKNKAKGTAHHLSCLMTIQQSPVDMMLWYTGLGFAEDDVAGQANYTVNGYAYRMWNMLYESARLKLSASGDEVVEGHLATDTTNFMVTAGRSPDGGLLYILVSNLNSNNSSYSIEVSNLDWPVEKDIRLVKTVVKEPENAWRCDTAYYDMAGTVEIEIDSMGSPSVLMLEMQAVDAAPTGTERRANGTGGMEITPNPAAEKCQIHYVKPIDRVEVYTVDGRLVRSYAGVHSGQFTLCTASLPAGVYLLRLTDVYGNVGTGRLLVH